MEADSRLYFDLDFAIKSAFLDLEEILKGNHNISVPFICGAPGGGKTSLIKAECDARNWNLLTKNTAMMLYEEFSGIPEILKGANGDTYAKWSKPQLVEELEKLSNKPCICFFDDWHRTNSSIQSLAFESFTDYTLKGFRLPKNVAFILAGNDSVAAGAREQLSATMNRVSKKYVKTNYESWKNSFAIKYGVNPVILGFLDSSENRQFFHMTESSFEPWASPRSWTYLSTKIDLIEASNLKFSNQQLVAEFGSYIGLEAASKLLQHWVFYKTVNPKKIFDDGKYEIPKTMMERFIFSYAILYEFVKRFASPDKNKACGIFSNIINDLFEQHRESGAILITNLSTKNPEITIYLNSQNMISKTLLRTLESMTNEMGKLENK